MWIVIAYLPPMDFCASSTFRNVRPLSYRLGLEVATANDLGSE